MEAIISQLFKLRMETPDNELDPIKSLSDVIFHVIDGIVATEQIGANGDALYEDAYQTAKWSRNYYAKVSSIHSHTVPRP